MINRWQGNSGRVQRLPERQDRAPRGPQGRPEPPPPQQSPAQRRQAPSLFSGFGSGGGILSSLDGLKKLLPSRMEELETEDIILLLILYLMYRESGDQELLMIMGAMFLL